VGGAAQGIQSDVHNTPGIGRVIPHATFLSVHLPCLTKRHAAPTQDRNSAALAPTKRGVCFNAAEWTALAAALPRLVNALRDEAEGTMEQLTPSLRATVSLFKCALR
jgi:hypothetical protein